MTDVLSPEQRHLNMVRIKGKNTGPEVKLRRLLYQSGLRGYRVHHNITGKPDVVFTRQRIAIFVDGCFWHKCPFCFKEPETRKDFWLEKINKNVERDKRNDLKLSEEGWRVIRIWEHQVKKNPEEVLELIARALGRTEILNHN